MVDACAQVREHLLLFTSTGDGDGARLKLQKKVSSLLWSERHISAKTHASVDQCCVAVNSPRARLETIMVNSDPGVFLWSPTPVTNSHASNHSTRGCPEHHRTRTITRAAIIGSVRWPRLPSPPPQRSSISACYCAIVGRPSPTSRWLGITADTSRQSLDEAATRQAWWHDLLLNGSRGQSRQIALSNQFIVLVKPMPMLSQTTVNHP